MVDPTRKARFAIVFIAAVALLWVPSVGAQQGPPSSNPGNGPPSSTPGSGPPSDPDHPCYPDGCGPKTTTTTTPRGGPRCGVALETAAVGDQVQATVRNVPAGGTVRLLFDGREVARGTNDAGVQSIRAMPAQAADVTMSFTVPDLPPGQYGVVAVGDTFTVTCGDGPFTVLAASGGGGSRGLAFTGSNVLILAALGLVLLAVGYGIKRRTASARR